MKQIRNIVGGLILSIILFTSCKYFVKKAEPETERGEVVARVDDVYLYSEDLNGLFDKDQNSYDSLEIVDHFIENWVKRQLMLKRAEANISTSQSELERKVDDYRYQLIVYEYQKLYIKEKLNNEVTDLEMEEYYNRNKDNFELTDNIVRCHYLKIPLSVAGIDNAKSWFKSSNPKNYDKLKEFGHQFALNFSFEDSVWYRFDDVVRDSPLESIPNKTNYIQQHKYAQATDSSYLYLLKINDYKISNEISPLEFAKDKIKNIILNQRKTRLIKELEQGIFNNAKNKKSFEIYKKN